MFATLPSNSQYTTQSCSQSSHRRKSKLDEQIVVDVEILASAFHQANADMSQNMFGSSKEKRKIQRQNE